VNRDNMVQTAFNPPAQMVAVPRPNAPDRPLDAYLVQPEGNGPFPGVVVIHEILGLNDNMRDIARRFADQGYVALAIDLFSTANRAICMLRIFYGMLLHPLNNNILADLQAALDFLQRQPEVNAARVGVIGFCMGGSLALQLACVDDDLRAASVFYGQNPRPLEAVARACPIVGSYPEKDFTARAARKLEPLLTQYNVPHDIKIYSDARHSFFNDQGGAYDSEAAADAWARTLAFFETHLK
jgi:carboxymethylenebutenolidase